MKKKRNTLMPALILVMLCVSILICGGATNTTEPTATPKNNPQDTPTPTVANQGGL